MYTGNSPRERYLSTCMSNYIPKHISCSTAILESTSDFYSRHQRYFIPLDYYHMKSKIVSFLGLFIQECNQVIFNIQLNFLLVCRGKLLFLRNKFSQQVVISIGNLLTRLITSVKNNKKKMLMNTRLYSMSFSFPVFLMLCCFQLLRGFL